MDSGQDNNYNENKAINNNFLLKKFSKDDNIQFILFELQVVLANSWFLGSSLYVHKIKVLDAYTTFFFCNHI